MNDDSKITENEKGDTGMEIVIARGKHIYIWKCSKMFALHLAQTTIHNKYTTYLERDILLRQCSYLCPILQTNCVLNSSHTTAGHRFSNTL